MLYVKKSVKTLSFCLLISTFSLSVSADNDGSQVGRYQIVFSPHARADSYLLDTVTGRTWEHAIHKTYKGEPTFWVEEDRVDIGLITTDYLKLLQKYGKKNDRAPDGWVRVKKDDNKK